MKNIKQGNQKSFMRTMRLVSYVLITLLYTAMGLSPAAHGAASATMNISPATSTVVNGSSISVTVQVLAGSNQITGAQACITFDTAKLTLTNTDTSSSALPSATPGSSSNCTAGETQISRFDFNASTGTVAPASGTFTLAVLTFQARQAGTTVAVVFDNAKSYVKDNATTDANGNYSNILSGSTGSTLTLNAQPAPAPSPAPASPPATDTSPAGVVTVKPDTPVKQAAITDTVHPTTQSSPITAPAQAASNEVKISPTLQKGINKKVTPVKAKSHNTVYIISGIAVALLVGAGLLIKFIGAPHLPVFGKRAVVPGASGGPTPPTTPSGSTISNIPDPQLPAPSTVVIPTQPPTTPTDNNQLPQ